MSVASFANSFSHSVGYLFIFIMVSFAVQKLLRLIRSCLFLLTLGGGPKNAFCDFCQQVLFLCFPLRVFTVSGLTCRFLIHFEFIFMCGVLISFNGKEF